MPVEILPQDIIYCYIVIYFLVPKFLVNKKYRLFTFTLIITTLALIFSQLLISYFRMDWSKENTDQLGASVVNMTRVTLIFGAPTVAIFFLAIKMFKTWYLKQREKQMLLKANADAEIQLLKAQVHPHFLFNTLNNIYSFALDNSPKAGELVLQLMDMMNYMITECNAALVPLEKELNMIRDYTGLEKVRYGNHFDLQVEIRGDYRGKMIVPLLMIPFVENAFKHGASKVLENPWIKLKIIIEKNILSLDISNNKSSQPSRSKNKAGIGLQNVEKRLKLLYPDEYVLNIESTADIFSVQMQVPLKMGEPALQNELPGRNEELLQPVLNL
jgi:LytS/YehU family sensor histidine kinase